MQFFFGRIQKEEYFGRIYLKIFGNYFPTFEIHEPVQIPCLSIFLPLNHKCKLVRNFEDKLKYEF